MKITKRLINIWKLGDLSWMDDKQKKEIGEPIIERSIRMAQIIRMDDPKKEILREEK